MAFVAIARNKFVPGFSGPMLLRPKRYRVVELRDALARVYTTDAHLVTHTDCAPVLRRQSEIIFSSLIPFR